MVYSICIHLPASEMGEGWGGGGIHCKSQISYYPVKNKDDSIEQTLKSSTLAEDCQPKGFGGSEGWTHATDWESHCCRQRLQPTLLMNRVCGWKWTAWTWMNKQLLITELQIKIHNIYKYNIGNLFKEVSFGLVYGIKPAGNQPHSLEPVAG